MIIAKSEHVSEVIEKHRQIKQPKEFLHLGRKFVIYPGVFSPFLAPSGFITLSFASWPIFNNKRVLEIGCGSGVISCLIAMNGAKKVVGVDINPTAVANAKRNAMIHDIEKKTDFRYGDLFGPITSDDEFDIIFADLPFTSGEPADMLEVAFFDPDIRSVKEYIKEVSQIIQKNHDTEAFLCFSDIEEFDVYSLAMNPQIECTQKMCIQLGWIGLELLKLVRYR